MALAHLEDQLDPKFARYKQELLLLLQRPVVNGGAGFDAATADAVYNQKAEELYQDVLKSYLSKPRIPQIPFYAEIFHMHVCTALWYEHATMSARLVKSPFLKRIEQEYDSLCPDNPTDFLDKPYRREQMIEDLRTHNEYVMTDERYIFDMDLGNLE